MALSENYRTETIGRSDCRPIVRLSADTIVRWDYRPNPSGDMLLKNEQQTLCLIICPLPHRSTSLMPTTSAMLYCDVLIHRTGPKHRSFHDLFTQISNILQQPAGIAVSKCINRQLHCAFEPFSQQIYPFWRSVNTAQSTVNFYNRSSIIVRHVVIRLFFALPFVALPYCFSCCNTSILSF